MAFVKAEGAPAGAPPPVPAPAPPQAAAASKPLPQPAARAAAGAAAPAPAPVAKQTAVEPVEPKKKSADAPKKAKDGKDKAEKKEGKEAKIRQLVTDLIKAKLLWNAVLCAPSVASSFFHVAKPDRPLSRSHAPADTTHSRAWTSATLQASYEAEEDEDLKLQCNLHAVTVNEALSEKLLEKHLEDAACAFDKRCASTALVLAGRSELRRLRSVYSHHRLQLSAGDGRRSGGLMSHALCVPEERR